MTESAAFLINIKKYMQILILKHLNLISLMKILLINYDDSLDVVLSFNFLCTSNDLKP